MKHDDGRPKRIRGQTRGPLAVDAELATAGSNGCILHAFVAVVVEAQTQNGPCGAGAKELRKLRRAETLPGTPDGDGLENVGLSLAVLPKQHREACAGLERDARQVSKVENVQAPKFQSRVHASHLPGPMSAARNSRQMRIGMTTARNDRSPTGRTMMGSSSPFKSIVTSSSVRALSTSRRYFPFNPTCTGVPS